MRGEILLPGGVADEHIQHDRRLAGARPAASRASTLRIRQSP
jgi:hypothetical protein